MIWEVNELTERLKRQEKCYQVAKSDLLEIYEANYYTAGFLLQTAIESGRKEQSPKNMLWRSIYP